MMMIRRHATLLALKAAKAATTTTCQFSPPIKDSCGGVGGRVNGWRVEGRGGGVREGEEG